MLARGVMCRDPQLHEAYFRAGLSTNKMDKNQITFSSGIKYI